MPEEAREGVAMDSAQRQNTMNYLYVPPPTLPSFRNLETVFAFSALPPRGSREARGRGDGCVWEGGLSLAFPSRARLLEPPLLPCSPLSRSPSLNLPLPGQRGRGGSRTASTHAPSPARSPPPTPCAVVGPGARHSSSRRDIDLTSPPATPHTRHLPHLLPPHLLLRFLGFQVPEPHILHV